jgi:hypothetical protein
MILHRLTEHVRRQDWFAVFLDFVVVGVFIAIQVANCNAARQDRRACRSTDALRFAVERRVTH